jgi:uncharacterized UBP type Zn finger protein
MLSKTIKFLNDICFRSAGPLVDDTPHSVCKMCGKTAWRHDEIKHKRTCEVGQVLKEVKEAAAKQERQAKQTNKRKHASF